MNYKKDYQSEDFNSINMRNCASEKKFSLGIKIWSTARRYSNSNKKFLEDDEGESEDEISLHLLDSILILDLCATTVKCASLQKEAFNLEIVWNEMKLYLASYKKYEPG